MLSLEARTLSRRLGSRERRDPGLVKMPVEIVSNIRSSSSGEMDGVLALFLSETRHCNRHRNRDGKRRGRECLFLEAVAATRSRIP